MRSLVVAFLILLGGTLQAARAGSGAEAPAWSVLQKAQSASQKLSYQGILSIQSGKHMQSTRVAHVWDSQLGELESMETLQGQTVEWIRRNDEVQCVIHDTKTIRLDKRTASDAFSAMLAARVDDLAEHYSIAQKETDKVAGSECQVYELRPKDGLRYGYRLWIDRETGLLMRTQTLGDNDEVLEQVGFSEIRVGPLPDKLKPKFKQVGEGWRVEKSMALTPEVNAPNVLIRQGVPGFKRISDMPRKKGHSVVNQTVYSDGLASVSVFVEPFDASKPTSNSVIHHGAVKSVVRRVGDYSVTVMGEVPLPTVKLFLNNVEIRKP